MFSKRQITIEETGENLHEEKRPLSPRMTELVVLRQPLVDTSDDFKGQINEALPRANTTELLRALKQTKSDLRRRNCKKYAFPGVVASACSLSLGTLLYLGIKLATTNVSHASSNKFNEVFDQYKHTRANSNDMATCNDLYDLTSICPLPGEPRAHCNDPCDTTSFENLLPQVCIGLINEICSTENDATEETQQNFLIIGGIILAAIAMLISLCGLKGIYNNYYSTPITLTPSIDTDEKQEHKRELTLEEKIIEGVDRFSIPINIAPHEIMLAVEEKEIELSEFLKSNLQFLMAYNDSEKLKSLEADKFSKLSPIYKDFFASPLFDRNVLPLIFNCNKPETKDDHEVPQSSTLRV